VGSRDECGVSGEARAPEGHFRHGEVVNRLDERIASRLYQSKEGRRQGVVRLTVQPAKHVGGNEALRN
jgi:hypothetical protein